MSLALLVACTHPAIDSAPYTDEQSETGVDTGETGGTETGESEDTGSTCTSPDDPGTSLLFAQLGTADRWLANDDVGCDRIEAFLLADAESYMAFGDTYLQSEPAFASLSSDVDWDSQDAVAAFIDCSRIDHDLKVESVNRVDGASVFFRGTIVYPTYAVGDEPSRRWTVGTIGACDGCVIDEVVTCTAYK